MNQLNTETKKYGDKRTAPRMPIKLNITYEHQNQFIPCETANISINGIAIRSNSILVPGDEIKIIMEEYSLPSVVVRSNGNTAGLRFFELSDEQLSYIKWLSGNKKDKNFDRNAAEKKMMKAGKKSYVLKAEMQKDEKLLSLFLVSIRKDFKGLADIAPVQNGAFRVEIYNLPSFVASFESLITFWKMHDMVIN
jgi:hypothetical protein